MQTAEYDYNDFQQTSEADKQLAVRFYYKAVENKTESKRQGRPIFKEKEFVEIRTPGNRTDFVARPATQRDKNRFPRHYEAFKQRVEVPEEGTLLAEWGAITRSQAEELSFHGVKTVEQLVGMSDTVAQKFMGINTLKEKAKRFIDEAAQGVNAAELADELTARDAEISQLKEQMTALLKRLDTPTSAESDKPELSAAKQSAPSKLETARRRPRKGASLKAALDKEQDDGSNKDGNS